VVKKTEYTSNNYDAINAHADTALDNERQLLRLRRFKADRYWLRNFGLALLAVGLFIILLTIAYTIYKKYYGMEPIIETRTIEVVREVPGPESVQVITREVPVPGPEKIIEIPGETKIITVPGPPQTKIITVPGPPQIVIKKVKVPIQADKDIDNFTLFSTITPDSPYNKKYSKVWTGRKFANLNSPYPSQQYCYVVDAINTSLHHYIYNSNAQGVITEGSAFKKFPNKTKDFKALRKYCRFDTSSPVRSKSGSTEPLPKSKTPSPGSILSGSGFFVNNQGYAVTNNHVVESCKSVWVKDTQSMEPATVIDKFPENDLAIVQIVKATPDYAKFTNAINPVADVMALGFPRGDVLGEEIKRTKGSISSLSGLKGNDFSLQHTAPIQRGNSGGPLVDSKGSIVGVNYAKPTDDELQGIGLAIKSINTIKYLGNQAVDFELNSNDNVLDWTEIFEEAKKYTVRIICQI